MSWPQNINTEHAWILQTQQSASGHDDPGDHGRGVLHFQTGSARLLPKVIGRRTRGPLFLSETTTAAVRAPTAQDRDPATGRARLGYRTAAEVFSAAAPGRALHQLRHSAITHLTEAGLSLPLLMAKSGHLCLRTHQMYARPSVDAVAALTPAHD